MAQSYFSSLQELQALWQPENVPSSTNHRRPFHGPGTTRHPSCIATARQRQEEIQSLERDVAALRAQVAQPVPSQSELLKELIARMNQLGQRLGQQLKECPNQVQLLQDRITPLNWLVPDMLPDDGTVDGAKHAGPLPGA